MSLVDNVSISNELVARDSQSVGIALSKSTRSIVYRHRNHAVPVVAIRETALTPPDRNLLLNRMVCLWPDPAATPTGDIPLVNSRDVHSRSISAVSRAATTA
jgi:hypothetical protein